LQKAIDIQPNSPQAHFNLAITLQAQGKMVEAIASFTRATQLKPDYAEAHNNLAIALERTGQLDAAIASYRRAIAANPNYADAYYNLGIPLHKQGQISEAITAYQQAICLNPNHVVAHSNLGNALAESGQVDPAIAAYQQAILLDPRYAEAHYNLGIALHRAGRLDEAITAQQQAIAINPNYPEAFNNLGNAYKDNGQITQAIHYFRQSIALKPSAEAHSNLIFALHYDPASSATTIRDELAAFNQQYILPLRPLMFSNDRAPTSQRRLRIGYVSPDFCQHVVGRNLLPLFEHHDRTAFEIFCYSNVRRADAMTERFRGLSEHWCDIEKLSDAGAARQIHADQIDILVDLALHTARNRLGVFAYKPAPIQICFAGYPGATGIETMDYRLTDAYLDPVAESTEICGEKPWQLGHSFWCYVPMADEIPVHPLPAQTNGLVTFGCLANFCKINPGILTLWTKVLQKISSSRMLIMAPTSSARDRLIQQFAASGIEAARIEFVGKQSRNDYLRTYNRIDICLDTFPYNGHTTSLDAFWMGVPVITLAGNSPVARAGVSQLSNLGLTELISRNEDEYVEIAAELANDLGRLAQLRQTLRARMEKSPLMDGKLFAAEIEKAYREISGE
jgi:predicted O-linked N-acetylglucosamine transferase (SPINDLY family)